MAGEAPTLGDRIREARVRRGLTLRQATKNLDVTPSYLSDIENERRVPAEATLERIAALLGLDFNELMGLAGRFGEQAERYVRKRPMAVQLFRRIAEADLSEDELRRLLAEIGGEKRE